MTWQLPTIVALLLALAGPPLFVVASEHLFGPSPRLAIQVVLQLLYCALPLVILWITVRFERLPLRSIGLQRTGWSSIVWGVILWGVLLILPVSTCGAAIWRRTSSPTAVRWRSCSRHCRVEPGGHDRHDG